MNRGSWASRAEGYSERLGWGERTKKKNSVTCDFKVGGLPLIMYAPRRRWGGGVFPIHLHCVLHEKKRGAGVRIAYRMEYVLNGRPLEEVCSHKPKIYSSKKGIHSLFM